VSRVLLLITPPPKHTSPSYKTADWPGVTAHWALGKIKLHLRLGPRQIADRILLAVAGFGMKAASSRRYACNPTQVIGMQLFG
jgi:hypothetical protein